MMMILRWGKPPGSEHNTNLAWSNLAPTNSFFSLSLSLSLTLLLLFFWFFIFYFAAEVIDMQKEIYSMAGWSIVFFNISVNQYFVLFYYLLVFNALLKYCQSSLPAAIAAYRSNNLSIYRKLSILRNLRSIKSHCQSQVFTVYIQVATNM